MAETLQSHLSHPVLAFYRAQHLGQSWLVSLATVLDSCTLLIVGGEGFPAAQARLYLPHGGPPARGPDRSLGAPGRSAGPMRLTEADLPTLLEAARTARLTLTLGPDDFPELLRLVQRYDCQLVTLAAWLVVPLPSWIARGAGAGDRRHCRA